MLAALSAPKAPQWPADRAAVAVVKLHGAGISIEHGYGVGVVASADGLVVTAPSLLLSAAKLRAVLPDGRTVTARVITQDEEKQIALLQLDAKDLPFLVPHDSSHMLPGDAVFALGNPYKIAEGEEPVSLTRGVLSLRTSLDARRRKQTFDYRGDVLLFDCITSNPGMAGGPLLDLDGHWIGLIGKVVVSERTNTYMSFAIPAEAVAAVLQQRDSAAASRAVAGPGSSTRPNATDPPRIRNVAATTGIKLFEMGLRQRSAFVDSVRPGSPAAKAGLKPDDLILAVNNRQARSAAEFRRLVSECSPGQRVSLAIKRGEKVLVVDLTLGEEK